MQIQEKSSHQLGLFRVAAIGIVAVDSLRNLPIGAQYGFSLIFFYLIAGLTFFFPLAWITSKLAVLFPQRGGSYLWIRTALGDVPAQTTLFLQWIYNIIWYPTIFTFISSTLISLLYPDWNAHKWLLLMSSIGFFWVITIIHCFGSRASSLISLFGSIIGTLVPMMLIIGLGAFWLGSGLPSASPLDWKHFFPDAHTLGNVSFFSNILFALLGLDVTSAYASQVKNQKKTFPRAIALAALFIFTTLTLSSLVFCIIIPTEKISLLGGLMDILNLFFNHFHIPYAAQAIGWCVVVGGIATAASWMDGLARNLSVSFQQAPGLQFLSHRNRYDAPNRVLIMQAIVYTSLLLLYLLIPNINQIYWMFSALSAQFALMYYIILFYSAHRLLKGASGQSLKDKLCSFGLPLIAGLISLVGIAVGFIPPQDVPASETKSYIITMVMGFVVVFILLSLKFLNSRRRIPV